MSPPRHTPEPNSVDLDGEFPLGPAEYFFYLLFQTQRQRDLALDKALTPTGLNLARWRTLAIVRRIEDCTMTLLARYSTVERTTLTRAVDQLVERGLLERWTPDKDRRQVRLALTEFGETTYGRAVEILKTHNADALAGVDAASLRQSARVMRRVLRQLVADPALGQDLATFGHRVPTPDRE
jgi:DNA-binding MarR family transcriptional regulator